MDNGVIRPLQNITNCCYANSFFQIILHLNEFSPFFEALDNDDPFKKFYSKYFDGNNTAIRVSKIYKKLSFWRDVQNGYDVEAFLLNISAKYPTINQIMGIKKEYRVNGQTEDIILPLMQVNQSPTVQQSIEENMRLNHYMEFKSLLMISIWRLMLNDQGVSTVQRRPVKINEVIKVAYNGNTKYYRLKAIIVHTGDEQHGHFQSILLKPEEQIYVNDLRISHNAHFININNDKIETNASLLVYREIPAENITEDFSNSFFNVTGNVGNQQSQQQAQNQQNRTNQIQNQQSTTIQNLTNNDKELLIHNVEENKRINIPDKYEPIEPESTSVSSNHATTSVPLHEHFETLHGYIRTTFDPEKIIKTDYKADAAKYQTWAVNLGKFCKVLAKLPFNYKISQGDDNWALLVNKLNIKALMPTQEQVHEAAIRVHHVFELNKNKKNLDVASIEKVLYNELYDILTSTATDNQEHEMRNVHSDQYRDDSILEDERHEDNEDTCNDETTEECIADDEREIHTHSSQSQNAQSRQLNYDSSNQRWFSDTLSDPNGTHEDEMFHKTLGSWYKWKERVSDFGEAVIEQALNALLQQLEEEEPTQDMIRRDELKRRIIEQWQQTGKNFADPTAFAKKWVETRNTHKLPSEITYSVRSVTDFIVKWTLRNRIDPTGKRGGAPKKYTLETLKCLLCTVLDYPDATSKERADYINKYGPADQESISDDTINHILEKMKITIQTPAFSPIQRNSMGYRIARVLWVKVINNIKNDANVLLCFVDEASVVNGHRKKARGFCSIRPCVNRPLNSATCSVLSCVIPNIGPICRWFNGAVHNNQYAKFLRDIVFVMRAFICNNHTQICIIQDNCSIHKTKLVYDTASALNINLINTVPYSPQLNILAENMFAQLKNNALYKFKSFDDEDFPQAPAFRSYMVPVGNVMSTWDNYMATSYNYRTTANVFGAWLHILAECEEGKPLSGMHYSASPEFAASNVHSSITYRRYI